MRVDQVNVVFVPQQAFDFAQPRARHGIRLKGHADLGQHWISRVPHLDTLAHFAQRRRRHAPVLTPPLAGERKPRDRGDHAHRHSPARHQPPQTRLNEDAMPRARLARIERCEGQHAKRTTHAVALRASPRTWTPLVRRNASNISRLHSGALWSLMPD